jgi:phenylacetate-coenzyme A ligase PaaK-like adenylate-forming protein
VLSSFFGKPLIRYRMHDLIRITGLVDDETGVKLPQMVFAGRSSDYIDLAGFTGLIDEKMVWQAIVNSAVPNVDWTIRKEHDAHPFLHIYIELTGDIDDETARRRVDEELKKLNSFYADYTSMIETQALVLTRLSPGTFSDYRLEMQNRGADLAHLKPAHMNAPDEIIQLMERLSNKQK